MSVTTNLLGLMVRDGSNEDSTARHEICGIYVDPRAGVPYGIFMDESGKLWCGDIANMVMSPSNVSETDNLEVISEDKHR